MWTWSIQCCGMKTTMLADLQSRQCPSNDDGTPMDDATITQFNAGRDSAATKVKSVSDTASGGPYVECSVSGNDSQSIPTVRYLNSKGKMINVDTGEE